MCTPMIDLHSHLLPGIDDGASDLALALRMAQVFVADGVEVVACTPHILPGLYHNSGPQIRQAVASLQAALDSERIPLRLTTGADNHIVPDVIAGLKSGHLLTLGDTRYVLIEPPHHVAPARLEDLFFSILVAGYVPILTHPERLTWIKSQYALMQRLVQTGVWMQVTSGSLSGAFGRDAQYWAERMLDEGCVHILATDAHDVTRRPPDLARGRDLAAKRLGDREATHLVHTRPRGVLDNRAPSELPLPPGRPRNDADLDGRAKTVRQPDGSHRGNPGWSDRVRRLFNE
jgi:protein-tyrosine phosphatase